jgi:hypothetical protein
MIRLKTILNELKLNDLVGNQYKYVIGSSEEKYIGENDKKYVLEMIEKSLKTYLYDDDFALNYLDGSQRKEYNSFFEREVLTPMLKKVDFTLNNFFVLDGDKVKWKLSSNDTRKMVDEIFRKNSKVPSDIKKEYYEYRLEYAGVKLKEGVTEETKRDYKAEYKKFQSSTEAKKYRAELNKYNRDKGTYGNGDGKDASHKNGKIVGFEDETVNRGRAEKSRLKKEGVNESDLKGYLIADVVDDIIKAIGPRFVSGEIKQSNRNKIYLKLTDVKVGSGVVKLLKSKFGIDAKEEMFGGKDKFGSIPSVSFFANKVINEELYKVAGRPVTLIKGKKSDGTDWKVVFQNGKETSLSDVLALIKPFPKDVHWRYKNLEGVNEASMPPVRKVVNAILKKYGIVPMKTTSTSVRGFHNIQRGGYRYEGNYFLGFYGVPQDIIDKVGDEMKKAGVKDVDVRKGIISADFTKTGLNEAAVKTPDFIVTSIPADAIPPVNISKADVGLGLSMFDALGRGWTLNNKDYKLDYHNGKVALKLTSSGKTAVRVKSGHDPKYVQKIEKFANDYLSKYAKEIKK